jgi:type VI secretion system secreted protein Hcp
MAFDAFLKLDGIPGESTDAKHKDEIEVLSFSWGVSNSGAVAHGGGGGAGKATFQDFSFMSRLQRSSPKIWLACATGEHIKSAVLTLRKAGGEITGAEFYKVTLTDVLVSSFQESGSEGGDDVPFDSFSLNYAKIRTDYTLVNQKGSLGGTTSAEFDLSKNAGGLSEPAASEGG